ncbi:helix-turn-helix domain-containing protein [Ructibacterium gallinarum]|uniref:Helix-turn-helix transcriptional regulator n=1 Tax=Ructibacterium gallinarum TaxID=2779355 RepID=A0A9D5LYY1_9FIRM|nr:helix-turn-helix domain-containing protein [Ructibacterium gallinarum]MBE5039120.1 helix-turn-helix transcriptional regulator [Ructibacterium gallinarum]
MKLFTSGGNHKIVFAWFVSYMLILFFTSCVNFIAYIPIEQRMEEQNNHYVTELLENRKEEMDNLRTLVNNAAVEISHNETINRLAFSTENLSGNNYYRVVEAAEALAVYKTIESEFQNVYVYFHKLNYCVGLNTSNIAQSYFKVQFGDRQIKQSDWMSLMIENHNGEFIALPSESADYPETVLYLLSLYGTERFVPAATIVIEVNSDKFTPASGAESYNEAFFIINAEGKVFPFGNPTEEARVQEIADTYGVADGISTVGKQIMIANHSENSEWKYLYLVDKSVFQSGIRAARRWIITLNILGIFVVIFIAFLFARKNYQTVQQIINLFGSPQKSEESGFRYIESRISDIVAENQAYSKITEKLQDNVIRSAFLSRLLNERVHISNKEEMLDSLGISFPYPLFQVVLFYIEINDDMFFDNKNDDTEESYRLARLILTNILGDLLAKEEIVAEYCDVEGMLAGIVNLKTEEHIDKFKKIIQKLQEFLLSNFNIRFMAGMSDSYTNSDDLPHCYSEAMSCMEQYFFSSNDVVTYSELENTELTDCYIPRNMEEQLVNGMKVGNYEICVKVLDRIFQENIFASNQSVQAAKIVLYELTAIMIRTIAEQGIIDDENAISDLIHMVDNIGVNMDAKEITRRLQGVMQSFCTKHKQETVQKTDILTDRAKLFVDEHYMEPALTVAMIAENCNVSMAYLSTNFKKRYQSGLLEYINLVRIEHAKKILEDSNDTMERVAELVGYSNMRSFFRMFSRYVGTSPNRYRAMMLAKKKEST